MFVKLNLVANILSSEQQTENLHLLAHLLHVSKYILPAVKHALALLCVQAEDKVCCVVSIAFLISETKVEYWVRYNATMSCRV